MTARKTKVAKPKATSVGAPSSAMILGAFSYAPKTEILRRYSVIDGVVVNNMARSEHGPRP